MRRNLPTDRLNKTADIMDAEKKGIKGKAKWLVYISHFITGWDEHMWMFALGLFLVEITPESLQFSATYGLVSGGAILLFGTLVGDWVDNTPRLTVARTSVIVQNVALIVCSILVFLVMTYKSSIAGVLPGEGLLRLCYAFIVIIAIVSNLTNLARATAIERDWIVEICGPDKDMLANLSATMRRISLLTMVIAPIVTGQILTNASHGIGALSIAGWNLFTIFAEYYLLWKIYDEVPQLQGQKVKRQAEPTLRMMDGVADIADSTLFDSVNSKDGNKAPMQVQSSEGPDKSTQMEGQSHSSYFKKLFSSCITLHRGWRVYKSYDVAFAGLGLSSLYLTVLGFDGITTGFAYSQGLSESLIGGLLGAAAFTGIIGTILYPILRRRIGIQRTGLYAIGAQISSLTLCVISIWCPGSPFDPLYFTRSGGPVEVSLLVSNATCDSLISNNTGSGNYTPGITTESLNPTEVDSSTNGYGCTTEPVEGTVGSYVSISLLMTGIIGARVGLWMADLTITQLFLETVHVSERGIVNGVQNALNQMMDMLKFAIVISLPVPEVFGYLVIISFCFIVLGWILLATYVRKARGYLLPCNTKGSAEYSINSSNQECVNESPHYSHYSQMPKL